MIVPIRYLTTEQKKAKQLIRNQINVPYSSEEVKIKVKKLAKKYFHIADYEFNYMYGTHFISEVFVKRTPSLDTETHFAEKVVYIEKTVTTDAYGQDLGAWDDGEKYREELFFMLNKETLQLDYILQEEDD